MYKFSLVLSATVLSLCDLLVFAVITALIIIMTKVQNYKGHHIPQNPKTLIEHMKW